MRIKFGQDSARSDQEIMLEKIERYGVCLLARMGMHTRMFVHARTPMKNSEMS